MFCFWETILACWCDVVGILRNLVEGGVASISNKVQKTRRYKIMHVPDIQNMHFCEMVFLEWDEFRHSSLHSKMRVILRSFTDWHASLLTLQIFNFASSLRFTRQFFCLNRMLSQMRQKCELGPFWHHVLRYDKFKLLRR